MSYIGIIFKVWFLQDSVLFRVRFGSVQQYNFIQQCSKHSISLVVIFIFSIGQYDESPPTSQHRKQHYFNSSGINLPVIPEKLVYGDWTSTPNNSNIYKKKSLYVYRLYGICYRPTLYINQGFQSISSVPILISVFRQYFKKNLNIFHEYL